MSLFLYLATKDVLQVEQNSWKTISKGQPP